MKCQLKAVVVTLFPEMFTALTESGISRRAFEKGRVEIHCVNPRDFTTDKHATVDSRPYGGGPGMVMMVEPLMAAVEEACKLLECVREQVKVVYLSPQGRTLNRMGVEQLLSDGNNFVFVCGRYEGVDERFINAMVDEEWSIGDYVLSGGELPAMVMLDALIRKVPGVLGDEQSAEQDSFEDGLLDCPHYTRPETILGQTVPPVLLSGDHKKIAQWRAEQSLLRTRDRRPDLLNAQSLTAEQQAFLSKCDS